MSVLPIDCPQCVWTQVINAEKQGRIRVITTNPAEYFYIIKPAGEDPPNVEDAGTRLDFEEYFFQYRETVDIYILTRLFDGKVIHDDDAPSIDTFLQDQTTPTVIVNFNQVHDSTTLAAEALIDQRDIVVASSTGIVVGSYVILFSLVTERFYFGRATIISGAPTITLDTPLDSTFPAGSFVDIAITDLSVNGLIAPQTFGLRGLGAPPGVDIKVDITRILFTCVADSPISLSLFADLPKLLNGIVLRLRNGTNRNLFNAKSNREMAGIMFDFDPSVATNPSQGEDGFKTRFTITRTGVVSRLAVGEDLELIIQDNLLGITILECTAEGHIVD